jgi:hypothetical protein
VEDKSAEYKIDVYTSDLRFAGTDANVTMTLFGSGPPGTAKDVEVRLVVYWCFIHLAVKR